MYARPLELLEAHSREKTALVPIRVEFETDTHRIRDCFVWNLHEDLVKPESFARILCTDLELPLNPWVETIANQIRAQIEEHEGVASMELGSMDSYQEVGEDGQGMVVDEEIEIPECRVILSVRATFTVSPIVKLIRGP